MWLIKNFLWLGKRKVTACGPRFAHPVPTLNGMSIDFKNLIAEDVARAIGQFEGLGLKISVADIDSEGMYVKLRLVVVDDMGRELRMLSPGINMRHTEELTLARIIDAFTVDVR